MTAKQHPIPEPILERIAQCVEKGSLYNLDSPHRRELRRILKEYDLAAAEMILTAQRVARCD